MSQYTDLSVVILAAGKGTRMKSSRAKVLHEVLFKPMLHHVLDAAENVEPDRIVVIVGHQEDRVRASLKEYSVEIVRQEEQLGTGHAVLVTKDAIPDRGGLVMILCGDTPLISASSLHEMVKRHIEHGRDLTVMTTLLDNPFGYGRIITSSDQVSAIVEEKEATAEQKRITEINAGIYLVGRELLFTALETVTPDNSQGEFYLTDIVEHAVKNGKVVGRFVNLVPMEVLGVNSKVELAAAHRELARRKNIELMESGVTIYDPDTVAVAGTASIAADTQLMQNVHILGRSVIGRACVIGNGAIVEDCVLGENVTVGPYSFLRGCSLDEGCEVLAGTVRDDRR